MARQVRQVHTAAGHNGADDPHSGASGWLLAALAGGVSFAGLAFVTQDTWRPTVAALAHDPAHLGLSGTLTLVLIMAVPCAVAATSWFAVWELIRLLELARYLRALHHHLAANLAQHSTLTRLGYVATGLPFGPDGRPRDGVDQPLAAVLADPPGSLLLGDFGMGKTVALRQYALELTRRRRLFAVALGRAPIPVLAPLAGYAAAPSEGGGPRLRYLTRQVEVFASPRFAVWLLVGPRRRGVVLLLDGLENTPLPQRATIVAELSEFLSPSAGNIRLIVTCALAAYTRDPTFFAALSPLRRIVAVGPGTVGLRAILQKAPRSSRSGGRSVDLLLADPRVRGLGAQIGHPATLAAIVDLLAAGEALPDGRGHILTAHVTLCCRRVATPTFSGGSGAPSAVVGAHVAAEVQAMVDALGRLAVALRNDEAAFVPLAPGEEPGDSVARWLASVSSPRRDETAHQSAPDDSVANVVGAAKHAGLLECFADVTGIRFAHRSIESACAALALAAAEDTDDDTRPLDPALLKAAWFEPLLIWAGISQHPETLAHRILGLAAVPPEPPWYDGDAPLAALDNSATAVALALAVGLEAFAPRLLHHEASTPTDLSTRHAVEHAQSGLRDVLDRAHVLAIDRGRRQQLAAALGGVECEGGVDAVAHLSVVAACQDLSRLVRAQAVTVLGAWRSPAAVATLTSMLDEADPVIRQAVDDALIAAGAPAIGPLQAAMSGSDERLRARASAVLGRGGASALAAAIASLDDADAPVRAAAARTLGALGAARTASTSRPGERSVPTRRRDVETGIDALHAHLDDPSGPVRVASAWALGRIGSRRSVPILTSHLSKPDPDLRAAIAQAFGAMRSVGAVEPLLVLLGDPDARVRASAAEALGRLGDRRAVDPLRQRLADDDLWSKAAAATALRLLGAR